MNLDYSFFETDKNIAPAKGKVLISEPFLQDNYFKRSIVLLTEYSSEGAVGFVLNKPIDLQANDVIKDFPKTDALISLGGPVNTNTLHYLHTLGDIVPKSVKVLENIFWGGNFEVIKKLIESGNIGRDQVRFFLGYSGWHANQLEDELADNSWVVSELEPQEIMAPISKHFWKTTLRKMGKKYEMWANFPENPQMN